MTSSKTLEDTLSEEADINHVIDTLSTLCRELRDNPDQWENASLERYLDAMKAWLTDVRDRVGDKPSWKLIAIMLDAATMYE